MNKVNVGLSAWIIQDGNYTDFEIGQTYSFASEFYPYSLQPSRSHIKTARLIKARPYQINAQVEYRGKVNARGRITEVLWI